MDKAETAEFFDKIILVHTEPVSTYPKYLYLPDWCTDEDTKFTELFYIPTPDAIKVVVEDIGSHLLYHDHQNCNYNPELVFSVDNEEATKKLFFLLTGQELKKEIPNDQVIALSWSNGEYYYGTDEEEWTIDDVLNFIKNNEDSNLVGK